MKDPFKLHDYMEDRLAGNFNKPGFLDDPAMSWRVIDTAIYLAQRYVAHCAAREDGTDYIAHLYGLGQMFYLLTNYGDWESSLPEHIFVCQDPADRVRLTKAFNAGELDSEDPEVRENLAGAVGLRYAVGLVTSIGFPLPTFLDDATVGDHKTWFAEYSVWYTGYQARRAASLALGLHAKVLLDYQEQQQSVDGDGLVNDIAEFLKKEAHHDRADSDNGAGDGREPGDDA